MDSLWRSNCSLKTAVTRLCKSYSACSSISICLILDFFFSSKTSFASFQPCGQVCLLPELCRAVFETCSCMEPMKFQAKLSNLSNQTRDFNFTLGHSFKSCNRKKKDHCPACSSCTLPMYKDRGAVFQI